MNALVSDSGLPTVPADKPAASSFSSKRGLTLDIILLDNVRTRRLFAASR